MKLVERFHAKVDKSGVCWTWTAARNNRGYGKIGVGSESLYAHRISWELHHGLIPDGMRVLHSCDNPPCVNPAHLFLGTQADNMADMWAKGRARIPVSDGHPILREDQVREIRLAAFQGVRLSSLAASYGVSYFTIWDIKQGRSWRDVA